MKPRNDPDEATSASPSKPGFPWLGLVLAAAACWLYLASELYVFGRLALPLDDSWIHLQFARNLAAGEGLAYQPGRWVAGSTAPLWTALLAIGYVLPVGPLAWAKALGVAFFLGTVHAADRLAAELDLQDGPRIVHGADAPLRAEMFTVKPHDGPFDGVVSVPA